MFIGCVSGSVLSIDVVGASKEKQDQLSQAAFELSNTLSTNERSYPSVIILQFHLRSWTGAAPGVLLFFSPFMPDDDVGLQMAEGRTSSIAIRNDLKGQELREIFIHEIGHVLGIPHSEDTTDIMYKYSDDRNLNKKALERFKKTIPSCK